jgi:hypothetical protein
MKNEKWKMENRISTTAGNDYGDDSDLCPLTSPSPLRRSPWVVRSSPL